jgi:Protein of unknown function (DUF2842)
MHIRTRKLIGTFALLVLVTLWALLAMAVAQARKAHLYPQLAADPGQTLSEDAKMCFPGQGASKYFKSGARIPISRV